MMSLMARLRERTVQQSPVDLPDITGQLKYTDEHGHNVTAYRRGRNSWVLDHTSHTGGEVLRFYTSAQLVDELNRRSEVPIEVTGALPS